MDTDNPALNADGSYKDAAEIEWDHSPTQLTKTPIATVPASPTVGKSKLTFKSNSQLGPRDFNNFKMKWKWDQPAASKPSINSLKGKDGTVATDHTAPKKTAVYHVKALHVESLTSTSTSRSTTMDAENNDDNSDNDNSQQWMMKKRKKGDSSADVYSNMLTLTTSHKGTSASYACKTCL